MKKILLSTLLLSSIILASNNFYFVKKSGVKAVTDELYLKECGSCHFAFQPGLLPERSWKKMMNNLADHFGSDATLEPEDHKALSKYLTDNAADNAREYKRSIKIVKSIANDSTPDKITDVPYFVREHKRIPKKVIMQEEIKTLSNCTACHTTASKGVYGERAIKIPNYDRWDD